jgi:CRISPR system Cascade subunit CasD
MTRLLVFAYAAPLMAFGDVAPGERRVGVERPTRSGLVGLIAAALGLKREDARQAPLAGSLAFAVRTDAPGRAMVDYHTTQTAPARRNRRFATRREELAAEDRSTILSQRAYMEDAAFTVAALVEGAGPFSAEDIASALVRPRFTVHAGRRACPLGLPPAPVVVEAATLGAAFAAYDAEQAALKERAELIKRFRRESRARAECAVDLRFEALGLLSPGFKPHRREIRRDDPQSRVRWQFSPRERLVGELEIPEGAAS